MASFTRKNAYCSRDGFGPAHNDGLGPHLSEVLGPCLTVHSILPVWPACCAWGWLVTTGGRSKLSTLAGIGLCVEKNKEKEIFPKAKLVLVRVEMYTNCLIRVNQMIYCVRDKMNSQTTNLMSK